MIKAAGTTVAKKTIGNTLRRNGLKYWSDVTKIKLFGINSTCRVWRGMNAEYDTNPTVKHGGGNIMLWGRNLGEDLQRGMDQNPS